MNAERESYVYFGDIYITKILDTEISISWDKVTGMEVMRVEQVKEENPESWETSEVLSDISRYSTYATVTNLTPDQGYCFRVVLREVDGFVYAKTKISKRMNIEGELTNTLKTFKGSIEKEYSYIRSVDCKLSGQDCTIVKQVNGKLVNYSNIPPISNLISVWVLTRNSNEVQGAKIEILTTGKGGQARLLESKKISNKDIHEVNFEIEGTKNATPYKITALSVVVI